MRYEVWEKSKLATRHGQPDDVCYVIDTAQLSAVSLSKGTTTKKVYVAKKDPKNPWGGGNYEDVEEPNVYIVVARGDKQSEIRCFGIAGKLYAACDCKRCGNTGQDVNTYGISCSACKGAGYKPKV